MPGLSFLGEELFEQIIANNDESCSFAIEVN
jgi:hypothetical protein